ncbi:hypothetical protein RND81_09G245200 [Saponaria officinalis]|uniref:sterol 3beta-glucosyltransferase n=1 Tax=Saponaria officinalis TaxID=3572 RepID=A0AAW1IRS9_SAPOF
MANSGEVSADVDGRNVDGVVDGGGDGGGHGESDPETELTVELSSSTRRRTKSSGCVDSLWSNENNVLEESSTSNHLEKPGGSKRYNPFSALAAKLFDEKVPLKKKLKWMNRVATVKKDGTVQFEVPGDINTSSLDMGTESGPVIGTSSGSVSGSGTGSGSVSVSVSGSGSGHTTEGEQDDSTDFQDLPPMQIVMLIVGTRGDVQPFVAIGKRLQEYGHRVRLATHQNFKEFVLSSGLEFFPLGGDPKVLAGYMVKNKGFLPSEPSEIPIQRNQIREIIFSLLPACKHPDPETQVPFHAEAIIANPPAYGHTQVAEALKIPIHIFFTMPWTPTSEFPHPLSRVKTHVANRFSYQVVDVMIWLGIRDMINEFRKKKLKLRPVTYLSPSHSSPLDIPYGYIWSPHLVPKPKDWGPRIDVVGFCFLDLASNYKPPEDLLEWLQKGQKPIYIGFGSLVCLRFQALSECLLMLIFLMISR